MRISQVDCHCSVVAVVLLWVLYAPAVSAWSPGSPLNLLLNQKHQAGTSTTLKVAYPTPKRRFRKQIQSKPRPTVTYDPTAGTITKDDSKSTNRWGSFKNKIYGTVDAVGSIASKLRRKEDAVRLPTGGYHDEIESRVFTVESTTVDTPAERLMKEYKQQGPELEVVQPEQSGFDAFKESFYSATDGVFPEKKLPVTPPLARLQPFKASTQPKISASIEVREALPLLNSPNPIKRFFAARKIRRWEVEQRKREEALERERQLASLKEGVYAVVDTVQAGAQLVVRTPEKIVETASATQQLALGFAQWASTVPGTLQSTADSVAAIPAQVGQTAAEVQGSIDNTVKSTQQFVEGVVAIPKKVQRSLEDTQRSVQNTAKSVDTTITNVKVWTGLEEPPPPPPKPPKELTISNLALDLAGGVAQGGANVAWWLGKGLVNLSWKGAKGAFAAATAPAPTKDKVATPPQRTPAPPQDSPITDAVLEATADIDVDISEALKLARTALRNAENQSTVGNADIEEAVRLAKEAAIAATQDAVEIEDEIKRRTKDNE